MEAIQVSINRQVDKEDAGQTHRYREIHTQWNISHKKGMKFFHLQQHGWT